jgi:hypothetical protein
MSSSFILVLSDFLLRKMDKTVRNGPRMIVFKERLTPPNINWKRLTTKEEIARRRLGSSIADWRSKLEKFNKDFAKWF